MSKQMHFNQALSRHPKALEELSHDTLLRYLRGEWPKSTQWLLRYPALLRALAKDAEEQQQVQQNEGVVA